MAGLKAVLIDSILGVSITDCAFGVFLSAAIAVSFLATYTIRDQILQRLRAHLVEDVPAMEQPFIEQAGAQAIVANDELVAEGDADEGRQQGEGFNELRDFACSFRPCDKFAYTALGGMVTKMHRTSFFNLDTF
jgi:hypothetical protein